ncbi:MAG: hypothetical protein ABGZ24_07600, partial [Fuerstiella sp.]
ANDVEKLIAELNREFQERLGQMKSADTIDDLFDDGQAADKLPRDLADMQARREKLDAILRQLRDMETDRRTQQNVSAQ